MIHAQQIELDKIKERERVREIKRVRSKQQGFGQTRFSGESRPQFKRHLFIPAPSSASGPIYWGRQELRNRLVPSRS